MWLKLGRKFVGQYGVGVPGGAPNTIDLGYKTFCALNGSSSPNGGVAPYGPVDSAGRYHWIASVNAGYAVVSCID